MTQLAYESFCIDFGKHKGKTLDKIATEDPEYLLWLNGTLVNSFSLSVNGKTMLDKVRVEHPECLIIVKAYVEAHSISIKEKLGSMKAKSYAKVAGSIPSRNYHYHPYGKRD